jgi:hypothetical protein
MMSPESRAMSRVREEANRLGLACAAISGASSLMHLAYDRKVTMSLPSDQCSLLKRLNGVK